MIINFDLAATKATEILIKYHISTAPIDPLPVLKKFPGVVVVPFAEAAHKVGIERESLLDMMGNESRAAVTTVQQIDVETRYIVVYNQRMPFVLLQRALARELGHIALCHDGTRPVEVRMAEAYAFALHFLCPRALIRTLQESPHPLTVETLGNVTGCFGGCLSRMNQLPGANVPPELNRILKDQFAEHIKDFMRYQPILSAEDRSPVADFGTYMDNYEE